MNKISILLFSLLLQAVDLTCATSTSVIEPEWGGEVLPFDILDEASKARVLEYCSMRGVEVHPRMLSTEQIASVLKLILAIEK